MKKIATHKAKKAFLLPELEARHETLHNCMLAAAAVAGANDEFVTRVPANLCWKSSTPARLARIPFASLTNRCN